MPRRDHPLSRDLVLGTAVALADATGMSSVSMRKVAAELGVEAMSLYHHVANKDDLLDGMVDAIFAEIELPSRRAHWKRALRARSISVRAVLNRHPWAVGLLDSRSSPGPNTLDHHEAVLGVLRRSGFDVVAAAHAFSILDSYTYGFVLQEVNIPASSADEFAELAHTLVDEMTPERFPFLTEIATQVVMQPGYTYGDEFLFGLDLVLDGLDGLRTAE